MQSSDTLKKCAKIALAAMAVLIIGAIIFYKERTLFADSAYLLFNIINTKHISIEHHRYGAIITLIVPYIATHLHLSVKTILFTYDVWVNLFYFLVAAIIVYRYKQYGMAVLMALYYFLFVSDSYFLPNDEINQGIAWMFLFFAVTIHYGSKKANILWLVLPFSVLAFFTLTAHFVLIIPTTFLWVYLIIEKRHWQYNTKNTILLTCILLAVVSTKFMMTEPASYDSAKLKSLFRMSIPDIVYAFKTPVIKMFIHRCCTNYWLAMIVFFIGIYHLVKENKKLLITWVLLSCAGYLILMGVVYGDFDKNILLFHIELEWKAIAVIMAAPFVLTALPRLKSSHAVVFMLLIFLVRTGYIASSAVVFHKRYEFKEQIYEKMKEKGIVKLALKDSRSLNEISVLTWAFPFETIMASAMHNDSPRVTFFSFSPQDKRVTDLLKVPGGFYDVFGMTPVNMLNHEYFLMDSTQSYRIMSYEELMK